MRLPGSLDRFEEVYHAFTVALRRATGQARTSGRLYGTTYLLRRAATGAGKPDGVVVAETKTFVESRLRETPEVCRDSPQAGNPSDRGGPAGRRVAGHGGEHSLARPRGLRGAPTDLCRVPGGLRAGRTHQHAGAPRAAATCTCRDEPRNRGSPRSPITAPLHVLPSTSGLRHPRHRRV